VFVTMIGVTQFGGIGVGVAVGSGVPFCPLAVAAAVAAKRSAAKAISAAPSVGTGVMIT
jgi:hypothetical protein